MLNANHRIDYLFIPERDTMPPIPSNMHTLVRTILRQGAVSFTRHATERMEERNMTEQDVENTLHGGHIEVSDIIDGTPRYRASTPRMVVVFVLEGEDGLRVISAWRIS